MRAEEHLDVVEFDREAEDRGFVKREIGFGAIEPDGRGVVGVAGEEKACGAVEEANGIGSVAGSGDDLEFAATEIENIAVLNIFGDGPGLGAIGFGVEILGKLATDLARGEFILGVLSGAFGILAGEIGVHRIDGVELPVAADVIVVSVRIENDDREGSELADEFADVADAHAGVKEESLLLAEDEVGNDFFELMRLVNGESVGSDFIDLEPGIGGLDAFEGFVFGAGEGFAPVGDLRWLSPHAVGPERTQKCEDEDSRNQVLLPFGSDISGRIWLAKARTPALRESVTLRAPSGSTSGILNKGLSSGTAALLETQRL